MSRLLSSARRAMRDDCLQEVSTMLGRELSARQGEKIEQRVRNQMRVLARENPEEWRAKTYSDRLHEAAAAAATEMKEEDASKAFCNGPRIRSPPTTASRTS